MKINRQTQRRILTAIRDTQADERTCDEISAEMFTRLAEARLAGRRPSHGLASIAQHLHHCPDCAQQLNDVITALQLVATEDTAMSSLASPPFDLSFLQSAAVETATPARVQAAFRRGVAWVQDQSGDLWINLGVGRGLAPPSNYLAVTKGGSADQKLGGAQNGTEVLYQLVLGAEEVDDLDLEVIGRREGESDFCTLTVQAVIPSRWPQIGGVDVDILFGLSVRHARTNEDGEAIFRNIPVAELPEIRVRVAR